VLRSPSQKLGATLSLFAELQRRRVFRALVGYGVVAFAVLQIIEPVMHGLHWPDAVLSYVVVALAVGFPVVVSLAWIFDVNAGRIERTRPVASWRGVRLAGILAGIGALTALPGVAWYFVLRPAAGAQKSEEATRAAPEAVPPASEIRAAPAIAILPFVNLSSDKEQEYFADGLTEELLNLLAKVPGLRVAARTSAFAFKGKNEDIGSIADKLHVATVLEGSVRKSGERVRITTQLINARDGYHLWSETYDRKLIDIFAVQDEIAQAVVTALKLRLLQAPTTLQRRTAVPEAHNQLLLGRQFLLRTNLEDYRRAVKAYQRAVELDPDYAPAWAGVAVATYWAAEEGESAKAIAAGFASARAAADKAVALAPELADGYRARGEMKAQVQFDWSGAEEDLQRALALEPESAEVLSAYAGVVLLPTGRMEEALAFFRKAVALDPLNPRIWGAMGLTLLYHGQPEPGRQALERSLEISPAQSFTALNLALSLLLEHRPADALDLTRRSTSEVFRLLGSALAHHDLGHVEESRRLSDQMVAKFAHSDAYQIAQAYAWRGEKDRAFEWLERARAQHDGGLLLLKEDPTLRLLHGDPRWGRLLAAMRLPAG
jgi:TolB-like protein/Tfp pilus assembly protein PilF